MRGRKRDAAPLLAALGAHQPAVAGGVPGLVRDASRGPAALRGCDRRGDGHRGVVPSFYVDVLLLLVEVGVAAVSKSSISRVSRAMAARYEQRRPLIEASWVQVHVCRRD